MRRPGFAGTLVAGCVIRPASPPDPPPAFEHPRLERLFLALACVGVVYLLYRAVVYKVEYYDGYTYLVNAWRLIDPQADVYDTIRPPLLALLQAPVVALARLGGPANPLLVLLPRLLAAALTIGTLIALYAVFRPAYGRTLAALGVLLFVSTRYFVRYGPSVTTDLPVAGLTAAAFALHTRALESRSFRRYVVWGLVTGAAIAMKYTAALALPALILVELWAFELRRPDGSLRPLREYRLSAAAGPVLGTALAIVMPVVLQGLVYVINFGAKGPAYLRIDGLARAASAVAAIPGETWKDHIAMARVMLSTGLLAASGVGLLVAVSRPRREDVAFFAWLAAFVWGVVFRVGHNEARYLLPVIPALLYFALRLVAGAAAAARAIVARPGLAPRAVVILRRGPAVAGAALLVLAIVNGARQVWEDRDPFFRSDVQRRLAAELLQAPERGGRALVAGKWHTLSPGWPGPLPQDEFWNTFHYAPRIASYFAGSVLGHLTKQELRLRLAEKTRDGDAVLCLDDLFYTTPVFPDQIPRPVELWKIKDAAGVLKVERRRIY